MDEISTLHWFEPIGVFGPLAHPTTTTSDLHVVVWYGSSIQAAESCSDIETLTCRISAFRYEAPWGVTTGQYDLQALDLPLIIEDEIYRCRGPYCRIQRGRSLERFEDVPSIDEHSIEERQDVWHNNARQDVVGTESQEEIKFRPVKV